MSVTHKHFELQVMEMKSAGFGDRFNGAMIHGFKPSDSSWAIPVDPGYVFDDVDAMRAMHQVWGREIERPVHRHRKGIYFSGPTGCGKTSFIEQFFARLNVPLLRCTWNPKREAEELISTATIVGGDLLPKDQAIALAARKGLPVLINEVDLAEPGELMALADVVEKGLITLPTGQSITAERGFMVFVTGNTAGSEDEAGVHHGTRSQNIAFLRRFFHLSMSYPTAEMEANFLQEAVPGISEDLAILAAKVAAKIRNAFEGTGDNQRLSSPISRPELIDWVDMMIRFDGLKSRGVNVADYALNLCFAARLPAHDRVVVTSIVELVFGEA